jgi:hypothetical protein
VTAAVTDATLPIRRIGIHEWLDLWWLLACFSPFRL